jgi:hypothetical protein
VEISRSFLAMRGATMRYAIAAIPPAASQPVSP